MIKLGQQQDLVGQSSKPVGVFYNFLRIGNPFFRLHLVLLQEVSVSLDHT